MKDLALANTVAEEQTSLGDTVADTSSPLARSSTSLLGLSQRQSILPRTTAAKVTPTGARFAPIRLLGKGGLGEVTLVRDNDIDRPVAVKRLLGTNAGDLQQFTREVRTVGQLEHPNVAPVHDVGIDDDGRPYFVMRYVEGETLEMVIAQLASGDPAYHRRFSFERRVEIFLNILHAIQYAHSKGIIHRDIKPANIMVGPFGEVQVMDWGIAKERTAPRVSSTGDLPDSDLRSTREGSLVGTPLYMSPEQARGRIDEIDERSDVYALSAVFYELLTLQHYLPPQTTVPGLLHAICESDHTKACFVPNDYQTRVPAELSWYIERGLAKDPAERYQSVDEMIDRMVATMGGDFPVQCPVTFMKRVGGDFSHFSDRHPVLAMGAIGGSAVLVMFAIVSLIRMLV